MFIGNRNIYKIALVKNMAIIRGNTVSLYSGTSKVGNLDVFNSFPYKQTSLNGEPKRLRNHFVHIKYPLNLGVLCIFLSKNAKFCVII